MNLLERVPKIQFMITIFPDNSGTMTDVRAELTPEETAEVVKQSINLLIKYAMDHGVRVTPK